MKIVFLGTGGSWPSPERNVSAIAVKRGSEVLLFDCGEGTQRQLMKSTVSFMQVKKIFITHFHGDHFLGLPGLIQSMSLNDRKQELEIYGPEGCSELILTIMNLGYYNPSYPVQMTDVAPGDILEFEEYTVNVGEASHNIPAVIYALEEKLRPGKFNKPRALEMGIPEGKYFSQL
ncbi:MAG: MBL fold metallo-hydrolase, partial [Candidatus Thermoplasmatota archaeon]|nr:MBL fold metallo-hydrolase [Candidatus Thermoplasmatota archaeon]